MDFDEAFRDLMGHSPYPWQRRLFERLVRGETYDALDIPTGLGKTSVIPIWLLAHLLGDHKQRPPMRLVYVVNRRTIVDQATEIAQRLQDRVTPCEKDDASKCIDPHPLWKDKFDDHVLAVSALRGALADNRQWLAQPGAPAIVIGTVDMIGSRLLFGAYRAGRWSSARHAGLIGQDSLIVHDEAHLSGPFQKLLDWVAERQEIDASARPMRVMAMSATRSDRTDRTERRQLLVIDEEDRHVQGVIDRLESVKRLHILRGEGKLVERIVARAMELAKAKKRVLIYVIRPSVAGKIAAALCKSLKTDHQRVELLTGTLRGYERDQLTGRPVYQVLANSLPVEQSVYLVSTSAGEVGADLDAQHLITDLSTIDAMIQRFGRVNRKGQGEADIDLLIDGNEPARKGALDERRQRTLKLLESLPASDDGWRSVNPTALRQLVDHADYPNATSPDPRSVLADLIKLDAWSLTSIHDPWPVAVPLDPYLHGLQDAEPETYLAWRAELDELAGIEGIDDESRRRQIESILEFYSLEPQELLRAGPDDVGQFLHKLRDRENMPVVVVRNRQVGLLELAHLRDAKAIAEAVRYSTVILPCSAGGLSKSGLLDDSEPKPVVDVADLPAGILASDVSQTNVERRRVILRRKEDGYFSAKVIGGAPIESSSDWSRWTEARDDVGEKLPGLEPFDRIILRKADGPTDLLLLFRKPREGRESSKKRVTVDDHNIAVRNAVGRTLDMLKDVHGVALSTAASNHDLGKKDPRWQKAIGNENGKQPLAKSFGKAFGSRTLGGYRHEFGSLRRIISKLNGTPEEEKDLVLHLIATHHGRGRPHFIAEAMTDFENAALPEELQPAAIARRFERLQRRFGHWGLAWLEAIFMAADAQGSQSPDDIEDEDKESDHG